MGSFFGHGAEGVGTGGREVCDNFLLLEMHAEFFRRCRGEEFYET